MGVVAMAEPDRSETPEAEAREHGGTATERRRGRQTGAGRDGHAPARGAREGGGGRTGPTEDKGGREKKRQRGERDKVGHCG